MLHICTWLWGEKYNRSYLDKLAAGVRRNLKQPHRFLCMTEREREIQFSVGVERHAIKDPELTKIKGCFVRLRLFDPGWQTNRKMAVGDRIVCIDLDLIVTGNLDELFDVDDTFKIFGGANAANPCPYNGSVWMVRAGSHPEVWRDFSLEAASALPYYEFPDDQGWMAHKLPNAATWQAGAESGVYGFRKPGWPPVGDGLPADAKIVAFFGKRDPAMYTTFAWVREHWRS